VYLVHTFITLQKFTQQSAATVMMELHSSDYTCQNKLASTQVNAKVASTTSWISPWLTPLAYFLGYNFLPLFFGQIQITGKENIPLTGPVIFAPTHRSRWDAILVPYVAGRWITGRDLRYMVTITECQGLQGWFVRRMGGFPVDIKHPSVTTLRHGVQILQQKEPLVIFPEGGIFRDGKVHPLKPGIARLALTAESGYPELGVKIVPIGINYSDPYPHWGTNVSIHIGSPIQVADYVSGNSKQDAKRLTTDLAKALKLLSHDESAIATHTFVEMPNS
jgi:1-acyl-sn-glycerol-3-phosphate acyltransferase